jgi:CSLREA domain-containing protein
MHFLIMISITAFCIGMGVFVTVPNTQAATITVNSSNDPGDGVCDENECTLREAIQLAATTYVNPEIVLGSRSIELNGTPLLLTHSITIIGSDVLNLNLATISGQYNSQVFHVESGKITIKGIIITKGRLPDNLAEFSFGDGIYNNTDLILDNCYIENNGYGKNTKGAGVYNDVDGKLIIQNRTSIRRNYGGKGAGIYNAGDLKITLSRIDGNETEGKGGGIYNTGTLTINSSKVSDNYLSSGYGAGIFNSVEGRVTAKQVEISENNHSDPMINGGGIYNEGEFEIISSTIFKNITDYSAGGIFNKGVMKIIDCRIRENAAGDGNGGGIYNKGQLNISGSAIIGNIACSTSEASGGGIFNAGEITLDDCVITDNESCAFGGGISNGRKVIIKNSSITNNTALESGGGVYNTGNISLQDAEIRDNIPDDWYGDPASSIDNCPNDPNKTEPGICGCGIPDTDTDSDGTPDCNDNCPNDSNKTEPGVCGCGIPDTDSDGDGILDCNDDCDNSIDTDGDGLNDCEDLCPNDPNKTQPGICGCGVADSDTDADGTLDCNDDCPNDPNKIQPGTCGCGILDTDTDLDGTPDCTDGCPNDKNKTQPGVCGCGIPDTDSDFDGIPDCNDGCDNSIDSDGDGLNDCDDLCPNDPNKTAPGTCGCGVSDSDTDGDGILDCMDVNDDGDGLPDGEEQGPDRNNPNYDGNGDGIADLAQDNVVSFHTYNDQGYITIASPSGTTIRNCKAVSKPSTSNSPQNIDFPHGFFGFTIEGLAPGDASTATMYFPAGEPFNTYYRYGPAPDNPINHWYEFLHDGQTGASINGNVITLHFVDGLRGDDDLTTNATISDIGAPGAIVSDDSGVPADTGSGGGSGGCFISTSNK